MNMSKEELYIFNRGILTWCYIYLTCAIMWSSWFPEGI